MKQVIATGRTQGDILARVVIAAPNFHALMLKLPSTHTNPDQIVAGFLGIKDTMSEEQIRLGSRIRAESLPGSCCRG